MASAAVAARHLWRRHHQSDAALSMAKLQASMTLAA